MGFLDRIFGKRDLCRADLDFVLEFVLFLVVTSSIFFELGSFLG